MTDPISSAINIALDGLADRRRVIDDNISNIQTPGFLAGQTDFESGLRAAMQGESRVSLQAAHGKSLAPTRTDGNNVDLDNETLTAIDTNLRYQAMVEAINHKFRLMRTAIG
jgi:flagellar basal-body rod protein FlgB